MFGLTQIGCTPLEMNKFGSNGKPCVEPINDAVNLFNDRFKPLVDDLNNDNPDARFTFINVTSILYPQGGKINMNNELFMIHRPCGHILLVS